jgi:hypothetical protein
MTVLHERVNNTRMQLKLPDRGKPSKNPVKWFAMLL